MRTKEISLLIFRGHHVILFRQALAGENHADCDLRKGWKRISEGTRNCQVRIMQAKPKHKLTALLGSGWRIQDPLGHDQSL
jgi:hypothetical protein